MGFDCDKLESVYWIVIWSFWVFNGFEIQNPKAEYSVFLYIVYYFSVGLTMEAYYKQNGGEY